MLESEIERHAKKLCKQNKIIFRKVKWVARRGAPDRLIGNILVEFKKPGEKLKDHQVRECKRLVDNGNRVMVIDSKEAVEYLINEILSERASKRNHISHKV